MTTMTNQSYTTDTREYLLPGYTTPTEMCKEELTTPTMSKESAQIYSNIRQCIPNTTENFSNIKKLDTSATEITILSDKIAELKKYETFHKVGSVIAIALLVTLTVAIILTAIFLPIIAPGAFTVGGALVFSILLGIDGPALPIAGIVGAGFWAHHAFNCVPNAQKELSEAQKRLSTRVEATKNNHEKLKTYFTDTPNYETLKGEIEASIDTRNEFLKALTGKKGADIKKLEKQYTAERSNFQKALEQLEALHNFYAQADST